MTHPKTTAAQEPEARGSAPESAARGRFFAHYTFVDYATQAYSALVAVMVILLHNHTVPRWPWFAAAHLAALPLLHWLVTAYGRAPRPGRLLVTLRHFYPVLAYLWFFSELGALDRMIFPEFIDPTVVRLEQSIFGSQPSRWLMERLPYRLLSELLYAAYFSYYVMILGVGIALFARDRSAFFHYISVVSFGFYVCYTFYLVLPVVGPPIFYFQGQGVTLPEDVTALFAGSTYPEAVRQGLMFKTMAFLYRIFDSPGAALPSSHVAIALTTVWFSYRYLPRIRHWHLGVAILLCIATVYCRYHYVVDVIAGMAAAAILIPVGNRLYFKYQDREGVAPKADAPQRVRS